MHAGRWCSAVLVLLFATGCGGSGTSATTGPSVDVTDGTGGPPSLPSYVVASVKAGAKPCAVEGGFGSVWVSVYGDDVVLRIDPGTRKVLARIKTDFAPCGIAVGGGSVWVENYGGASVSRIDPRTNEAEEIGVGSAPFDVTYAAGAAWTTDHGDNTVTRIDVRTGKTRTIEVGADPVGVAPTGGAVWVTNQTDGTLSRLDPRTLRVRTQKIGTAPTWTAWGDGSLWLAVRNGLVRIDEATGRAAQRVTLPAQPNDGDVADGRVWVADQDGSLDALSAADGTRLGRWPTGLSNPFVLAAYADLLWVVDFAGTQVLAIDPGRLPKA